jgi:poly(A) polymerase
MKPDWAVEIIHKLRDQGFEAYLVGGCVRDMVMNVEPADYDIATSARPEDIMRIFPRTEAIGVQFGVVLVIHRGHPFEVATFRSDQAYVDGRRPNGVVFTDARQDVLRRDFTVNGLLYDPVAKRVIDYVHGQDDIRSKIIRAIGDPSQRFQEDKLRILRAIRFAARLDYQIEPRTWQAVCDMAHAIHQVSSERIREEFVRVLTEGQASWGTRMMHQSGLLAEIVPELEWNNRIEACLQFVTKGSSGDFAMGVLLHELPPASVERIVERLKFSRAEMHHIVALAANLPVFSEVRRMNVSSLKRFFRNVRFEDHLELARIHSGACGADPADYQFAVERFRQWSKDEIEPALLVTGQDLIEMGFRPGPLFRDILTKVEDAQLEGTLTSREEAVSFIQHHFKPHS